MGGLEWFHSTSIQTDAAGNVYLTGQFRYSADFDPSGNLAKLISAGDYDMFIAKYDALGNYLWAKRIGGPEGDFCRSTKLDPSGYLYVTGIFRDKADFDPGAGNKCNSGSLL